MQNEAFQHAVDVHRGEPCNVADLFLRERKLEPIVVGEARTLQTLPALHGLAGGLTWTFYTIELVLVVAILLELLGKRLAWPFPALLATFLAIHAGTVWATGEGFASIARAAGAPV